MIVVNQSTDKGIYEIYRSLLASPLWGPAKRLILKVWDIAIESFGTFEREDFLWPYLTLLVFNEKGFRPSNGISIIERDARGCGLIPITWGAKSSSTAFEGFFHYFFTDAGPGRCDHPSDQGPWRKSSSEGEKAFEAASIVLNLDPRCRRASKGDERALIWLVLKSFWAWRHARFFLGFFKRWMMRMFWNDGWHGWFLSLLGLCLSYTASYHSSIKGYDFAPFIDRKTRLSRL